MSGIIAILRRDLLLSLRQASDSLVVVLFFVLVAILFPFGVGPEPNLLARMAPGVVWVAALLAAMLSLERMFQVDFEDGSLELANQMSLCRCGHSKNKPFCDEQHIEAEFTDSGRFVQGAENPSPIRPASLAVTCMEDGPLKFVGRMRIMDYLGQQCTKTRGNLCRCGHSANKPFCDGTHKRINFKTSKADE